MHQLEVSSFFGLRMYTNAGRLLAYLYLQYGALLVST